MSNCEITYRTESKSLEVTQQVFTNDFEDAIRAENDVIMHLNGDNEVGNADELISAYLAKHFSVTIDGESVPFQYLGNPSLFNTWEKK